MSKTQPAAATTTEPVRRRILERNFGGAEFKFNRWSAMLDETEQLEHALSPDFWTVVASQMMGPEKDRGRGDIIEVRKLDTGLYAELFVTEIEDGFVRVELIKAYEPRQVELAEELPFTTRWNRSAKGHEVIRKADSAVMAGPYQDKRRCAAWIDKHMAALGKKAA